MTTGFEGTDIDHSAASSPDMSETPPRTAGHHGESKAARSARRSLLTETMMVYALCIGAALAISALIVEATGGDAGAVFSALLDGSVRGPGRMGDTLGVAAPLLVVALGAIISSRAGLVNIGQEGQLFIGSAVAAYVGTRIGGPGPLIILALLVGSAVGGALWAGIAALLKYKRNVPEVLTTLLLVTIGTQLAGYGLKNEWLLLAPPEGRSNRQQISEQLANDTRIPRVTWFGNEFPISVFFALGLAAIVGFALARTLWGFRLRMLGHNPRTAQRAGVGAARHGGGALLVSGAFAGLAGGIMLAGGDFGNYTLVPGFPSEIGWTGLLVALVARQRVSAAVLVAFVFACLRTGSGFLASTGVERRITDVVQGLLVLALLIPPAVISVRRRRRALASTEDRT